MSSTVKQMPFLIYMQNVIAHCAFGLIYYQAYAL